MKQVFDLVYGFIEFPDEIWQIINHPLFQRLDRLRQCGFVSQVYPSATHTRKAHSLGVAHLANKWATHLSQYSSVPLSHDDRLAIIIAGLCHDIGHGPFSHLFDHVTKLFDIHETHEERSIEYVAKIINDVELSNKEYIFLQITHMIVGKKGFSPAWMYNIVSNTKNGLDVDRFDYLTRDSYYTIKFFDGSLINRIITSSKLVDDEIVFEAKVTDDILHLYKARYDLFNRVYCHSTVMKCESIILAAMETLDSFNYKSWSLMDDNTFLSILRGNMNSAALIDKLDSREWLPPGKRKYTLHISYAKTRTNPLEYVKFIDKNGNRSKGQKIIDLPENFLQERTIWY